MLPTGHNTSGCFPTPYLAILLDLPSFNSVLEDASSGQCMVWYSTLEFALSFQLQVGVKYSYHLATGSYTVGDVQTMQSHFYSGATTVACWIVVSLWLLIE